MICVWGEQNWPARKTISKVVDIPPRGEKNEPVLSGQI
jgi:hypothetical protein